MLDELLKLGHLVRPGETDTEIAHPCGFVALQRVDDSVGWSQPHEATEMDAASIVLLQKGACERFGLCHISVQAYRGVDTQGEIGE